MIDKIILVLPFITLLCFLFVFHRALSIQTVVLFVFFALPFMDLKVVPEALGAYKTFDVICFYSLLFFVRPFTKVYNNPSIYFILFVLFILTVFLGSLKSEFVINSLIDATKVLPIFIFVRYITIQCVDEPLFYWKAIRALKFSLCFALIFLVIQLVIGVSFTFYPGLSGNAKGFADAAIRYPGIFYDSQTHGQYIALASFLFLYLKRDTDKKEVVWNYMWFLIAVGGLIAAGSRSAFGGFAGAFVFVILFAERKFRIYGLVLAGLVTVFVLVFSPISGIFSRSKELGDDYKFRSSIWHSAYKIAEDHPYLGIGIGNYQKYVSIYSQDQYLENEEIGLYLDQPENGYLKVLVELGFLGFFIFCMFLLLPIVRSLSILLSLYSDNRIAYLLAGVVSWLIAFNTVYSLTDCRILIIVATFLAFLADSPFKTIKVNG